MTRTTLGRAIRQQAERVANEEPGYDDSLAVDFAWVHACDVLYEPQGQPGSRDDASVFAMLMAAEIADDEGLVI